MDLGKTAIIIFTLLVITLIIGFCIPIPSNAKTEQTWPLKIWKQNENGSMSTLCVIDEDTGVNYIVVMGDMIGHNAISVAITPRLNADGTLYVTD